jgi:hypothetical protein
MLIISQSKRLKPTVPRGKAAKSPATKAALKRSPRAKKVTHIEGRATSREVEEALSDERPLEPEDWILRFSEDVAAEEAAEHDEHPSEQVLDTTENQQNADQDYHPNTALHTIRTLGSLVAANLDLKAPNTTSQQLAWLRGITHREGGYKLLRDAKTITDLPSSVQAQVRNDAALFAKAKEAALVEHILHPLLKDWESHLSAEQAKQGSAQTTIGHTSTTAQRPFNSNQLTSTVSRLLEHSGSVEAAQRFIGTYFSDTGLSITLERAIMSKMRELVEYQFVVDAMIARQSREEQAARTSNTTSTLRGTDLATSASTSARPGILAAPSPQQAIIPPSEPPIAPPPQARPDPTIQPYRPPTPPQAQPRPKPSIEIFYLLILSRSPIYESRRWTPPTSFQETTLSTLFSQLPFNGTINGLIFNFEGPGLKMKESIDSGNEVAFAMMKKQFNKGIKAALMNQKGKNSVDAQVERLVFEMEIEAMREVGVVVEDDDDDDDGATFF